MNRHKITTARRVGEPSSKYGYQPELFEQDLADHAAENEALWRCDVEKTKMNLYELFEIDQRIELGLNPMGTEGLTREIIEKKRLFSSLKEKISKLDNPIFNADFD